MNQTVEQANELKGTITLPADKSISHRAAMFAALHDGTSTISNFSEAADPQSTLRVLKQLDVEIIEQDTGLIIKGRGRNTLKSPVQPLDCGNAGTLMRLLSGILGGAGINATLTGDDSLCSRTMKRIINPLRKMGINIKARKGNYAPLHISRNSELMPMEYNLPIPSAQLKSCILLAGLYGQSPTRIIERIPSRDHTERMLQLKVFESGNRRIIESDSHRPIPNQSMNIPGDFSAAAFWLVAGCIHPDAQIKLENVGVNPTRTAALTILQRMGANISVFNERVESNEPVADITVKTSVLQPYNIPSDLIPNCIDELPILSVAMLFADGTSNLRSAGELRHKETDRIEAMVQIFKNTGADFREFEDGYEIKGHPDFSFKGVEFDSFEDHRIAMSAAILALKGESPSTIQGAECAQISYPAFYKHLDALNR